MTAPVLFSQVADDSLRSVLDSIFANPRYQWVVQQSTRSWLARIWERLVEWLMRFRSESPVAFNWFYIGLLVILAAILLHGLWVFYRAVQSAQQTPEGGVSVMAGEVRDERWYRRRAQQLATQERYGEAMSALFQALVLMLDRRSILHFHPSKTPAEYAREARLVPTDRHELLALVRQLYRCSFAGDRCSRDEFQAWQLGLTREWHAAQG
ncbi:MAG: DUF4129 domain-containing protein [Gemmatimonadota bacterium]